MISICNVTSNLGRLGGLLGNYNHEPSDDGQGPDGQPVNCPAQLATRWAVGDEPCYQVRKVPHIFQLFFVYESLMFIT